MRIIKYYNPETGNPDPVPCPRKSKVCWYIHPDEPEWASRGKFLPPPPKRYSGGGQKKSLGSRIGRGRSRSRTKSRSRSRSRGRDSGGRGGRGRSRSRSSARLVSPNRRRPRQSSPLPPPRRPLRERIQRSPSPRPRSRSRPRLRNHSPSRRHPRDRRPRTRTSTPISSSRGPSPSGDGKTGSSPRRVKPEPSSDAVPSPVSRPARPFLGDVSGAAVDGPTPVLPQGSPDQRHQQSSSGLPPGQHTTVTSDSTQQPSPLVDPFSPVFAPETPVIPGLSAPVQLTAISSLQKSLEQVMKDQGTNQAMGSSVIPPGGNTSASHPAPVPEVEKTEVWTTRVKCVEFAGFVGGLLFF